MDSKQPLMLFPRHLQAARGSGHYMRRLLRPPLCLFGSLQARQVARCLPHEGPQIHPIDGHSLGEAVAGAAHAAVVHAALSCNVHQGLEHIHMEEPAIRKHVFEDMFAVHQL